MMETPNASKLRMQANPFVAKTSHGTETSLIQNTSAPVHWYNHAAQHHHPHDKQRHQHHWHHQRHQHRLQCTHLGPVLLKPSFPPLPHRASLSCIRHEVGLMTGSTRTNGAAPRMRHTDNRKMVGATHVSAHSSHTRRVVGKGARGRTEK